MRFSLSYLISLLFITFMIAQVAALPMSTQGNAAGYKSELAEEFKALGNKILEARNRGGKEEENRMLESDGWRAGGGFLTQMRQDGRGQLHPVQRVPISQMEQYVSDLEDQQTHDMMNSLGRQIARAYIHSGAVQGVAKLLADLDWKVSQDGRTLVKTSRGAPERRFAIDQMEQHVREYGLPSGVTLVTALREARRTPASARQ